MLRGTTAALAAIALLLTLGACSLLDRATDDPGQGSTGSGSEDSQGVGEPTSLDPALLECGDPKLSDSSLTLPDIDLQQTSWATPAGFQESFIYQEDRPVEHLESFWAAEPADNPVNLNALAVAIYSDLDWGEDADDCGRVLLTAINERLEGYNTENGATALTEVTTVDIGGMSVLQQDLSFPEYLYRGYWIFSRDQMVHVYCQWTSDAEKSRILAGCDELIGSVQLPG
ncbi:MAG: hypothetical protein ACK5H2_10010 [Beutenbergiaceae bacterium]